MSYQGNRDKVNVIVISIYIYTHHATKFDNHIYPWENKYYVKSGFFGHELWYWANILES